MNFSENKNLFHFGLELTKLEQLSLQLTDKFFFLPKGVVLLFLESSQLETSLALNPKFRLIITFLIDF